MLCLYITSYYSAFTKFHARRSASSEDLCRHLSHLRMTCLPFTSQYSGFPTSRAGRLAFSEDLYRFLSHLRMPCFNFTSYYSLIAVSYRSVRRMLASSRNHFCQALSAQENSLLENLAFPDDVSSIFLIFIVSDICYLEMTLLSVASCDFARKRPPFLASFRPLKNLKKKTLQKVISCTRKVLIKSDIFDPRRPRTTLDLYFFS